MKNPESLRRPLVSLALATALGVAVALPGCGSGESSDAQTTPADVANAELPPGIRVSGGSPRATRRVAEDCDPAQETLNYTELIGSRALATLLWNEASDDAAALEIPIHVTSIAEGGVTVRFLAFPMREQYMHVWMGSGHIAALGDNVFLLDPCSATLEPWPEP
jgi:hypothetical protein